MVEAVHDCCHWPTTMKLDVASQVRAIAKEKIKFMETLAEEKVQFDTDMKEWVARFEFVQTWMTDFKKAKNYDKEVSGLHDNFQEGRNWIADFNQREDLFNIEPMEKEPLEDMIEDYDA